MWKRWNTGTHIWERSVDNGLSWTQLPLNASTVTEGSFAKAQLPASVAYEDEANVFTQRQHILGGSGTGYNIAPIEIQMASYPRVAFHWPGVVASQIGMDSAGTITAYDNPGTGYAGIRAGNFYSILWYYEAQRPNPQGHRIAWNASVITAAGSNCGGSITAFYSLIGNQLWWSIYAVNISIPAVTPYLLINNPGGLPPVSAYTDQPIMRCFVPGIADEAGYGQVDPNYIQVYRPKAVNWPTGTGHVIGQGFYWIG